MEKIIWPNQAVNEGPAQVTCTRSIKKTGVSTNFKKSVPLYEIKGVALEKLLIATYAGKFDKVYKRAEIKKKV